MQDDGLHRSRQMLCVAVVEGAIRSIKRNQKDADTAKWFLFESERGEVFLDALGMNQDYLRRILKRNGLT